MSTQQRIDRRAVLKAMGAGLSGAAAWSTLAQLGMIGRASAQVGAGYKALVCVYLGGANDSFNWLVPRDSTNAGSRYDAYQRARGGVYGPANTSGLAHGFNDLLPIAPIGQAGFGLHPAHTDFTVNSQNHSGLQSLFNTGKLAFVCNTGTLIAPITKTEYDNGAPRPAQLFSHNDQENLWQLGFANNTLPLARTGWGGRLAQSLSGPLSNGLSPTISVAGQARFLIGSNIVPYQLAASGVDVLDQYSATEGSNFQSARRAVLNDLLDDSLDSPHAREYQRTLARALSVGEDLDVRLNGAGGQLSTAFPTSGLASQLALVARMIKVSKALGATRQVYYVRLASFDLHNGMFVAGQPAATSGHGALLTELNQAVGAFWSALGEIGAQSEVTTFSMSDFGRTLSGNGDGSDHGWGGNLMLLGNDVIGNTLYGRYPQLVLNSNDTGLSDYSFSRGQYIPTTAVEQVAATLARWMGVTDSNALDAMFPLLGNFSSSNLGFMR
jgi:uncharacterized protein (DUF1501 family)